VWIRNGLHVTRPLRDNALFKRASYYRCFRCCATIGAVAMGRAVCIAVSRDSSISQRKETDLNVARQNPPQQNSAVVIRCRSTENNGQRKAALELSTYLGCQRRRSTLETQRKSLGPFSRVPPIKRIDVIRLGMAARAGSRAPSREPTYNELLALSQGIWSRPCTR